QSIGRNRTAGRSHRPGNEHRASADLSGIAGNLRAAKVYVAHAVFQATRAELVAVSPERVGFDDVGTGRDVIAVNVNDIVASAEVERIKTTIYRETSLVQQRSHRAVTQHRTKR